MKKIITIEVICALFVIAGIVNAQTIEEIPKEAPQITYTKEIQDKVASTTLDTISAIKENEADKRQKEIIIKLSSIEAYLRDIAKNTRPQ